MKTKRPPRGYFRTTSLIPFSGCVRAIAHDRLPYTYKQAHTKDYQVTEGLELTVAGQGPYELGLGAFKEFEKILGLYAKKWWKGMNPSAVSEELNKRLILLKKPTTLIISSEPQRPYRLKLKMSPVKSGNCKGHVVSLLENACKTDPMQILNDLLAALALEHLKLDGALAEAIISTYDADIKIFFPNEYPAKNKYNFWPGLAVRVPFSKLNKIRVAEYWYSPYRGIGFTPPEAATEITYHRIKEKKSIVEFMTHRIQVIIERWRGTEKLLEKGFNTNVTFPAFQYSARYQKGETNMIRAYAALYENDFNTTAAQALALASTAAHCYGAHRYRLETNAAQLLGINYVN